MPFSTHYSIARTPKRPPAATPAAIPTPVGLGATPPLNFAALVVPEAFAVPVVDEAFVVLVAAAAAVPVALLAAELAAELAAPVFVEALLAAELATELATELAADPVGLLVDVADARGTELPTLLLMRAASPRFSLTMKDRTALGKAVNEGLAVMSE